MYQASTFSAQKKSSPNNRYSQISDPYDKKKENGDDKDVAKNEVYNEIVNEDKYGIEQSFGDIQTNMLPM